MHAGCEPLSDQVSNVLVIECVGLKDAAMYKCRASNTVNTVFSKWAEIVVHAQPVINRTSKSVCAYAKYCFQYYTFMYM